MFQTNLVEKIKTHILHSITFFENRTVYEIMWKNVAEPDRPQMTVGRMRFACRATKATKHTLCICNTYCFSTAIMDPRLRLNVTLQAHQLSLQLPVTSQKLTCVGHAYCDWILPVPASFYVLWLLRRARLLRLNSACSCFVLRSLATAPFESTS